MHECGHRTQQANNVRQTKDEPFDPNDYPMMKFAEMYFNDFPKDTSPFGTLTLRRAPRVKDPVPKSEMLLYTKTTTLPWAVSDEAELTVRCESYIMHQSLMIFCVDP